jgi:hypothetical protein
MPSDRHSVPQQATSQTPHESASATDPAQHGIFRYSHGHGLHHSPGVAIAGDSQVDGQGAVVRPTKIGTGVAVEQNGRLIPDLVSHGTLVRLQPPIENGEKICVTLPGLPSGMFL